MSETLEAPEIHAEMPAAATASDVPFFLVGLRKLVVMFVLTLGLYEFYWFYRHWQRLKRDGGEDVWPLARTVFSVLFSWALFDRVREEADAQGVPALLSPIVLAGALVLSASSVRFGGPLWLAVGVTLAVLMYVQWMVNALPTVQALLPGERNERLTARNWLAVPAFALVLLLLALPEPPPVVTPEAMVAALLADAQRDLPRTMTGGVILEHLEAADGGVSLHVRLEQLEAREALMADVVRRVQQTLLEIACSGAGLEQAALASGIPLRYTINDRGRTRIATMEITTAAQCPLPDASPTPPAQPGR